MNFQKIKAMFIDKQTGIIIHADLDTTVIRATHRPFDLIHTFLNVIKDTAHYVALIQYAPSVVTDPSAGEWDDTHDFLIDVMDALELYAPEGYYFGCTEGDGSDFGYWKFEEED